MVVLDESDESADEVQIMEPGYAGQCMISGDFLCVQQKFW